MTFGQLVCRESADAQPYSLPPLQESGFQGGQGSSSRLVRHDPLDTYLVKNLKIAHISILNFLLICKNHHPSTLTLSLLTTSHT